VVLTLHRQEIRPYLHLVASDGQHVSRPVEEAFEINGVATFGLK